MRATLSPTGQVTAPSSITKVPHTQLARAQLNADTTGRQLTHQNGVKSGYSHRTLYRVAFGTEPGCALLPANSELYRASAASALSIARTAMAPVQNKATASVGNATESYGLISFTAVGQN